MALKIKHIERFHAPTADQIDVYSLAMRWRYNEIGLRSKTGPRHGQRLAAIRKARIEAGKPWRLER